MALETDRSSPNNASSPGPASNQRPGSQGGSVGSGTTTPSSPSPPDCCVVCRDASRIQATCTITTPVQPPPPCNCCTTGGRTSSVSVYTCPSPGCSTPSPGCASSHGSSPDQLGDHIRQPSPTPPPPNNRVPPTPPTILPFSVANILKPEFGRKAVVTLKHLPFQANPQPLIRHEIKRVTTPICDYQRLFRPHESLPGVQPLPALKPVKKQQAPLLSWPPLAGAKSDTDGVKGPAVPQQTSPPLSPASSTVSAGSSAAEEKGPSSGKGQELWPAWVYCTRYSDRPSSGEI
uniref:Uncharacterized protein n=1 Tax=Timema tahoe TaxID=61484 RepID=A0A7R9IE45_9NEOP|nr:unnamed protein product [Timema tahoe]